MDGTSRDCPTLCRSIAQLSRSIAQLTFWYGLPVLLASSGCGWFAHTSPYTNPDGTAVGWHQHLQQEHLVRSHYTRVVPEPYQPGAYDTGTHQTPSRFHPVPTRNVFRSTPAVPLNSYGMGSDAPPLAPGELLLTPPSYVPYESSVQPNPETALPAGPPTYQPDAAPAPSVLSPEDVSPAGPGTEELPAPLMDPDTIVPPELERPETSDDKVTHNRLIQYPYTLDTQRPVAGWVRADLDLNDNSPLGESNTRSSLSSQAIARVTQRQSAASGATAMSQEPRTEGKHEVIQASAEIEPFAPEFYGRQFVSPSPQKVIEPTPIKEKLIQRVTSFGPGPLLSRIAPPSRKNPTNAVPNGVPYYPANDVTHPMYQSGLPLVPVSPNSESQAPVQLHSALHQQWMSRQTTMR